MEAGKVIAALEDVVGPITVRVDNQAALQALINRCKTDLQALKACRIWNGINMRTRISFHWVKAHVGTLGNERADELAKAATTQGVVSLLNPTIRECKSIIQRNAEEQWLFC